MTGEEKQKAIDALKISAPVMAVTQEEFNDYIHILNQVMDWLEQEPKWIPVSEKLPEKNVEILATTEWGAVTIAEMYSANDWFIHEGTTNAEADEIVAWMPLPKPFKPQESEG